MLLNVHCISLRVVRHSDSTSIVTAWSRERGRIVFAVPAGSGREAQRRRALMMPFSMFEGVANIPGGRDICRISDVRQYGAGNVSGIDPVRNVVAVFLADFLCAVLRESTADSNLTDYIFSGAETLKNASSEAVANFHLYFIYGLGHFLGIAPDMGTYAAGRFFDMREGRFTAMSPLHRSYVPPEKSTIISVLSRLTPRTLPMLRLSRGERNEILDGILEYYSIHYSTVLQMPSLQILRSIFGR